MSDKTKNKVEDTKKFKSERGSEMVDFINHIKVPIPENPAGEHWYIASPFSSNIPEQSQKWLERIIFTTGYLIEKYPHTTMYSPIAYTAQFAVKGVRPHTGWYATCLNDLEIRSRLVICEQEDWHNSVGIALEVGFAHCKGIPISTLTPPYISDEEKEKFYAMGRDSNTR